MFPDVAPVIETTNIALEAFQPRREADHVSEDFCRSIREGGEDSAAACEIETLVKEIPNHGEQIISRIVLVWF